MAKGPKVELSEYEQQRQANIAERDALLKELSLNSAATGLKAIGSKGRSTGASKKSDKKKAPSRPKKEDIVPRRQSSRIKGLEADSEVVKRKYEEDREVQREAERIKRQRVSGDLKLGDIVVNGKELNQGMFVDIIKRGAEPYKRTFGEDEVKSSSDKQLRALREKMSGLEIYDGWSPADIKITPERIYSMTFHPEPSKPLIFAGDKMGNLGIFDASQDPGIASAPVKIEGAEDDDEDYEEDLPDPIITSLHLHTRTISSMQFSPTNPSHLLTASYDSSVRLLDISNNISKELYGPEDHDSDEPLSGLEVDPGSPHVIYFSRLDGYLGRHDTRTPSSSTELWQLSEKKIGGFSIHPQYPHFLATASLDRTMRLFDLRKMVKDGEGGKRPSAIGEHTSRLSISHAAFNSVGQVATSSYDDTVKIYSFQGMSGWKDGNELDDSSMEPGTIVKHNNQTGRWVTILRPQWQANPTDSVQRFVIGNMNRFVDVYSGSGDQLAQLGSDLITAVPAVCQFHPTNDWIAGGTASGKLCLWK